MDYEEQITLSHLNDENNFDSEEDTEDASEGDPWTHEPVEIKEQMYQDKLENLKNQIADLKNGSHPEYLSRINKLENQYKERLRLNEIYRDYLLNCVEKDYILEKTAASKEYEEKKADLRDNLISDCEDKRKAIDSEKSSMELNGDTMEVKPAVTRKLRRRPNEPLPNVVEKRRKNYSPGQIVFQLEEKEIDNDLKLISRGKILTPIKQLCYSNASGSVNGNSMINNSSGSNSGGESSHYAETKIEDGKLLFERRWFHRGQPIFAEGKDLPKFAANISAIGNEAIWVKKTQDGSKFRICTSQLSKGKINIKRRAN